MCNVLDEPLYNIDWYSGGMVVGRGRWWCSGPESLPRVGV